MELMLIIKYTLIEAQKRKLWVLFPFILVGCFSIGLYARSLSIIDGNLALVGFYAAFIRVGCIFMLGLYLLITEIKTFEDARIQLALSLPISRSDLLLGKLAAYFIVSLMMVIIASIPILFYADIAATLVWSVSVYCEMLIMLSAAFVLVLVFKHSVFAIAVYAAFYIFSRSASEFQLHAGNILALETDKWLPLILKNIAYLVPKFDRFANSSWLMYGLEGKGVLLNILFQTVVFTLLLVLIALQNIRRKEF